MAAGLPIPLTSQVTIAGSTATLLAAVNINRKFIQFFPILTAVDVYIGASTALTSTNGFPIPARTGFVIDNPLTTGAIYGFSTAAQQVAVIQW